MRRGPIDEMVLVSDDDRTVAGIAQRFGDGLQRRPQDGVVVLPRVGRHSCHWHVGRHRWGRALIVVGAHDERGCSGEGTIRIGGAGRIAERELHVGGQPGVAPAFELGPHLVERLGRCGTDRAQACGEPEGAKLIDRRNRHRTIVARGQAIPVRSWKREGGTSPASARRSTACFSC